MLKCPQQLIYQNTYFYEFLTIALHRTHAIVHLYFENDKKSRLKVAFWARRDHPQLYLQMF